tara:strand:+ start:430 stop:543 length:114 start_codon:yes stop_codon:yes gene_type:complete
VETIKEVIIYTYDSVTEEKRGGKSDKFEEDLKEVSRF